MSETDHKALQDFMKEDTPKNLTHEPKNAVKEEPPKNLTHEPKSVVTYNDYDVSEYHGTVTSKAPSNPPKPISNIKS